MFNNYALEISCLREDVKMLRNMVREQERAFLTLMRYFGLELYEKPTHLVIEKIDKKDGQQ